MDFLKDLWGFLTTRKKNLVIADHPFYAAVRGLDRHDRWLGYRTIYLCSFLE